MRTVTISKIGGGAETIYEVQGRIKITLYEEKDVKQKREIGRGWPSCV